MSATKLKPCPFCGGYASLVCNQAGDRWTVSCMTFACLARGLYPTHGKQAACAMWNKRHPGAEGGKK